ncbi:hypothetical protein Q8A67_005029 [Cirrhinus molitorella]|uniref:Uncharacterized protein n=1 Tax=Cirrhinus molitorella TaxID=172907 RepID=A0AA88QBK8_9TELE|nr:hypothetical protein Q8A67_005029 [Cirrhinus molitorella]
MQMSLAHCINNYTKALSRSRYQRDVILNSADEWITMYSNQSEHKGNSLSGSLSSFSILVVLSIIWCFVFLVVFSICMFLQKIQQDKKQKSQPNFQGDEVTGADVSLNEVSEKRKKRERNKSYKERVNSVYYEFFRDHSPQRKPSNSDCTAEYK